MSLAGKVVGYLKGIFNISIAGTTLTLGTASMTVSVPGTLAASANTAKAFLYSDASSNIAATAAPTNGQLLIGSTGNIPAVATLTQGANITITNGAGSITIAATAAASTWAQVLSTGNTSGGTSPTISSGDNIVFNGAADLKAPATTASALRITDGTNPYLAVDTRSVTGVKANAFGVTNPSFASAAGNAFNAVAINAYTITQTGTTTITTLSGLSLNIASPTVSNSAGATLTVTTVSTAVINGPLSTTSGGGSMTTPNLFTLDLPSFSTACTQGSCLRVGTATGASGIPMSITLASDANNQTGFRGFGAGIIIYAGNTGNMYLTSSAVQVTAGIPLGWNASGATSTFDTCFSRLAANSVALGNGTQGDFTGTLKLTTLTAVTSVQVGSTSDAGVSRLAAKVIGATDGSSGNGWFQNSAGEATLTAAATNATASMAATNLSISVRTGRVYAFEAYLQVSNSVAADGFQFDFNGGGATVSQFSAAIVGSTSTGGTLTPGVTAVTAIGTAMTATVVGVTGTNSDFLLVKGQFTASSTGTVILRMAEVTHTTGTATLAAGSYFRVFDSVAL